MKNSFPGYFRASDDALTELWNNGVIIFDADILLNLYRYSENTRKELIKLMKGLSDQIWLPHRAAEEFLQNRTTVIGAQIDAYKSASEQIDSFKTTLESSRSHPFISQELLAKTKKVFDDLESELSRNKKSNEALILHDPIKDQIGNVFEGKVGVGFDDEDLERLIDEGAKRYSEKQPPGYKDYSAKKVEVDASLKERTRAFGDFIIWEQIISHAETVDKGVILITDDRKDDWWERVKGKTIGPRPELVAEFESRVGKLFHMYQADRFLEKAQERLHQNISSESLNEIRKVRESAMIKQRNEVQGNLARMQSERVEAFRRELDSKHNELVRMDVERESLVRELSNVDQNLSSLLYERNSKLRSDSELNDIDLQIEQLERQKARLKAYYSEISDTLQALRSHIRVLEGEFRNFLSYSTKEHDE